LTAEIIDLHESAGWDSIAISFPNNCFFHSSAWLRVLSSSYGYTPYALTVQRGTNRAIIVAAEVRSAFTGVRGVSLPFSDVVPILTEAEAVSKAMLPELTAYALERKWRYVELRTSAPIDGWSVSAEFAEHTLDLNRNEDDIYRALRPSTRRNIQKAIAEGVRVIRTTTLEAVGAFYHLHCITRKRHGLPPQPYSFFRNLHALVLEKGKGAVLLALQHERVVAGGIFVHFGQHAIYKFGASLLQEQHLRANNLVMWEAISWYAANEYRSLSLGRTDPENHGLLQYKNGWGGLQRTVYYSRWPCRTVRSGSFPYLRKNAIVLARRLPTSVLRFVGRRLYRHIG
jgi:hypothetical protein